MKRTAKVSVEDKIPLNREETHQFLISQAIQAELMRQTPEVADLMERASSQEKAQIASWLLRYTRIRRGFGKNSKSFGFFLDRQFSFSLSAASENPFWKICVPEFIDDLNRTSTGASSTKIWSTQPEMRDAIKLAFSRFLAEPSPVNRNNLNELMSQYALTDSGKHPYVHVSMVSGGLPGLGKRRR